MKTVVIDRGLFNVEEFLQGVVERAPENWANMTKNGKKQLLGCFDLLTRDGKELLLFPVWHDYREKEMAIAVVRGMAREYDCVACGISQEAWQVDARKRIPGLTPSEHPEHLRQEILYVLTLSCTEPAPRSFQWNILRSGSRARLSEMKEYSVSTETFRDLLPRREIKTQ